MQGVAETVKIDHINRHNYASNRTINPTAVELLGRHYLRKV